MFRFLLAAFLLVAAGAQSAIAAGEKYLSIRLKTGTVKIELLRDIAPLHVARVVALARAGKYDGIAFHRVIGGFMAQTGDVQYGRPDPSGALPGGVGTGGSDMHNVQAEFSPTPFKRGTVGAARSSDPNSANSQFFITFGRANWLDGKYTVWGQVVEGMEHVDQIKKGHPETGRMDQPDVMIRVTISDD